MSIEERIAKILTAHFWIEHRMECACGHNAGKPAWEYDAPDHVAHVAQVLTTELGMTPEWTVEYDGAVHQRPHAGSPNAEMKRRAEKLFADQTVHKRRLVTRYVTLWENA